MRAERGSAGPAASPGEVAYLVGPPSPAASAVVALFSGLGLVVKQPDEQAGELCVLLEVKRPEELIVCALAGKPYLEELPADPYARVINEEKARAAAAGQEAELRRLEAQELTGLAERADREGASAMVLSARRLRRIILDIESRQADMGAVLEELLSRRAPLFLMRNVADGVVDVRSYGAAGPALPVYCDLVGLEWAADDLGKANGSYDIGALLTRELITSVASDKLGLAICTFRDRKTPVYAVLPASMVAIVAQAIAGLYHRSDHQAGLVP